MREFIIVMRDRSRFVVDATSPSAAEACVILDSKYTLSDIMLTYEVKQ